MRENELRRMVEEIVKSLAQKGYLSPSGPEPAAPGGTAGSPPAGAGGKRLFQTTVGTAGKVFSDEWSFKPKRVQPMTLPAEASSPTDSECEGPQACRNCGGKSGADVCPVRAAGADRLAVCQPTKQCSKTARLVDHTLLKPGATQEQIAKLCQEARDYCFASVCVNPTYVALSASLLKGSGVKVCTVVGFPLGSTTSTVKAIEARDAIANGADEIDMVINVGALKSGNDAAVYDDVRAVREATRGKILKVILETALLSVEEKVRACLLCRKAGVDFVKTSTGFGGGGATVEDVRLMRETVGPAMGVKASGGIKDAKDAEAMIEAGATRLGTSASVAIVTAGGGASARALGMGEAAAGGGKGD